MCVSSKKISVVGRFDGWCFVYYVASGQGWSTTADAASGGVGLRQYEFFSVSETEVVADNPAHEGLDVERAIRVAVHSSAHVTNIMYASHRDLTGLSGWNEKLAADEAGLTAAREAAAPAQA